MTVRGLPLLLAAFLLACPLVPRPWTRALAAGAETGPRLMVPEAITAPPGEEMTVPVRVRGLPPGPSGAPSPYRVVARYPRAFGFLGAPASPGVSEPPRAPGQAAVLAASDNAGEAFAFFPFRVPPSTPPGRHAFAFHLEPAVGKPASLLSPAPLASAEVSVIVPPRARLGVDPPPPLEAPRGSTFTWPLTVRNEGNVALAVTVSPRLPRGWTARSAAPVRVEPGSRADVTLAVTVPPDEPLGSPSLRVELEARPEPGTPDAPAPEGPIRALVRASVTVLPPGPGQIARLPAQMLATIRTDVASPLGHPGPWRSRWVAKALFPGTPSAGHIALRWDDPLGGHGGSSSLRWTEFAYAPPGAGWGLRRRVSGLDETLLTEGAPLLEWQSSRWSLAVPEPGARLPAGHEPAPALLRWRPGLGDGPLVVGYRFPGGASPAATEFSLHLGGGGGARSRWHWAFIGGRPGWSARGVWPLTSGGSGDARWRLDAQAFALPPAALPYNAVRRQGAVLLEGAGRGYRLGASLRRRRVAWPPPGLRAPRETGPALAASVHRAGLSLARTFGPVGSALVDGRASWARTWTSPARSPLAADPALDTFWMLRARSSRNRFSVQERRHARGHSRSSLRAVSWRRHAGGGTWWQLSAGLHEHRAGPFLGAAPSRRTWWRLGLEAGWRDGAGRRWRGGVHWTASPGERNPGPGWHIELTAPGTAFTWSVGLRRDQKVEARLGLTYHVPLPWPGADPASGTVEGRLVPGKTVRDAPLDLGGAVLRLGGELVSTDEHGFFRFAPVPPGRYELTVRRLPPVLAGRVAAPAPLEVVVAGGQTRHAAVALPALGEIRGRVAAPSPGEVFPPAAVRVPGEAGSRFSVRLLDEAGRPVALREVAAGERFRFPALAPGPYRVEVSAAGPPAEGAAPTGVTFVVVEEGKVAAVDLDVPRPRDVPVTFRGEEHRP